MTKKVNWTAVFSVVLQTLFKIFGMGLVKKFVEKLLIKLIGASTGFQLWLIKFIGENLIKQILEPLINAAIVEGKYHIEVHNNKVALIKMEDAQSESEYYDGLNDLLD